MSRAAMSRDLHTKRFLAALVVSCVLHAALVFMPYLGTSAAVSWPVVRGGQRPGPARILSVRLEILETGTAAAGAANSAALAAAGDPPAPRMAGEEPPRPASERATGIGLLPIPAPAYYSNDQLTKRPLPTSDPRLDAPELSPIFKSGRVVLKIWINERGVVDSVEAEKSDLPEAMVRSAAAAFRQLRFEPGEIRGRPVGAVMRIEVSFDEGARPPP